jgi:KipI family sensor histidine kinase inhibitor
MISKSLLLNDQKWRASFLGEKAISLAPSAKNSPLSVIHKAARIVEESEIQDLIDVIPAYESIALIYARSLYDLNEEIAELEQKIRQTTIKKQEVSRIEVPVCYEMGLDWDEIEKNTKIPRERFIERHESGTYEVAMMGFLPGFIYLSGLDEDLSCPRKNNPRTKIPSGSVGIGGSQTGIYSLESPGGWQIIGRTPVHFFNEERDQPINVMPGDHVRFKKISKKAFDQWEV